MAERLAPGEYDRLHHFVAAGVWQEAPLEAELLVQANRLVGGDEAVLVIDDTALPKKGSASVGVAPQYASTLGKNADIFPDGTVRLLKAGSTIKFDFHWHIELLPRITRVAGFEWGTGFYINPTPPEEAAKFLRGV